MRNMPIFAPPEMLKKRVKIQFFATHFLLSFQC